MLERCGLLWGNSPGFLSGGKTRANHIYALNVADGTLNGARLLVYLPVDDAGERAIAGLSDY
ncbi:hypothetical protein MUA04_04180 [Enterobacteriaceae bacterium H11S18]|uniref:hypothetical protein n=1 Tax=Dryocola clanedunensis TaxID=2925396 RepID=UPI0022F111C3|nr:hypothetical protein [Dryocola clanedunensis]MCT4709386.1 hypothetical protein [Dryocola clanedunensis]